MKASITRAELLRCAIRRVQDLAADCGLSVNIGLHARGDMPSGLGAIRIADRYLVELADSVCECVAYEFLAPEDDDRRQVEIIVEESRRPKREAV